MCIKAYVKANWKRIYKRQKELGKTSKYIRMREKYQQSEAFRGSVKKYQQSEKGILAKKRHLQSETRKETEREYHIKTMITPEMYLKKRARQILNDEIQKGNIRKRNSCEICHISPTECHHEDYNKPLNFIELCQICHKFLHKKKQLKVKLNGTPTS